MRCTVNPAKKVDETTQYDYLQAIMTRPFFALLALLTGLAAFVSPAQASLVEALQCSASIAAKACEEATYGEAASHDGAPTGICHGPRAERVQGARLAPTVLRLPVLMGIERAYE